MMQEMLAAGSGGGGINPVEIPTTTGDVTTKTVSVTKGKSYCLAISCGNTSTHITVNNANELLYIVHSSAFAAACDHIIYITATDNTISFSGTASIYYNLLVVQLD